MKKSPLAHGAWSLSTGLSVHCGSQCVGPRGQVPSGSAKNCENMRPLRFVRSWGHSTRYHLPQEGQPKVLSQKSYLSRHRRSPRFFTELTTVSGLMCLRDYCSISFPWLNSFWTITETRKVSLLTTEALEENSLFNYILVAVFSPLMEVSDYFWNKQSTIGMKKIVGLRKKIK